jgi:hypothetical protein
MAAIEAVRKAEATASTLSCTHAPEIHSCKTCKRLCRCPSSAWPRRPSATRESAARSASWTASCRRLRHPLPGNDRTDHWETKTADYGLPPTSIPFGRCVCPTHPDPESLDAATPSAVRALSDRMYESFAESLHNEGLQQVRAAVAEDGIEAVYFACNFWSGPSPTWGPKLLTSASRSSTHSARRSPSRSTSCCRPRALPPDGTCQRSFQSRRTRTTVSRCSYPDAPG